MQLTYSGNDSLSRTTRLLDDGAYHLAASRRAIARSEWLLNVTRDLLVSYRMHRIRPVLGASDALGSTPDGEDTQQLANDFVRSAPLPDPEPTRPPRGTLGGLARAAKLSRERRSEIARRAAAARWERFRNGVGTGPPEARLGGIARAQSLSPERRQEIARQASQAMWERMKTTRRDPD